MAIGRPRITAFTKFLLLFIIVFPSAIVLSTYIKEGEVSTRAVWQNVKSMFSKKEHTTTIPTNTNPTIPTETDTPPTSSPPSSATTPNTTTPNNTTPVNADARVARLEDDLKEKDTRLETLYNEIDILRKANKTKTDSIQALTHQLQTILNALQKK